MHLDRHIPTFVLRPLYPRLRSALMGLERHGQGLLAFFLPACGIRKCYVATLFMIVSVTQGLAPVT